MLNLAGDIGFGLVTAALAPHDQPHLGGERLAERHRRGLAVASPPPHNSAMTPDLTDDDKAILVELLREVTATDRLSLSPRIKRLKVVLAKLDPPSPRSQPLPPPRPPGEP